jgi:hypothetical protein
MKIALNYIFIPKAFPDHVTTDLPSNAFDAVCMIRPLFAPMTRCGRQLFHKNADQEDATI